MTTTTTTTTLQPFSSCRPSWIFVLLLAHAIVCCVSGSSQGPTATTTSSFLLRKQLLLLQVRGGMMSDGGGSTFSSGGGIDDEDLDEYIDFLIAHADGKVPESENPLFKKKKKPSVLDEQEPQVVLASSTTTTTTARFQESSIPAYVTPAPVAEEEEETKTTDTTTSKVSLESTSTSNDAVVSDEVSMTEDTRIRKNVTDVEEIVEMQEKRGSESDFVPIVDDVEDDTQLDDMIETLVATVEDDEEEEILIKQEHKDEEEEEIPKEQTELVAVLDVEDVNQSDEMVDTFVVTVEDEDIQEKESSITSSAAQQEAGQDAQPALDFFLGPSAVEGVPSLLSEAASTDDETPEQAVENDVSRKVKTIFKHSVWTVKSKSEDVWSRLAGYLETKKESRLVEESGVSEPMEKMDITEGEALDNPEAASEGGGGRERKTEAAPVLAEKPDISAKVKTYYKKSVWAVKSKSVHAWGTFAKYLETKRKKPAEASVEEPRPRKERDYSKIYEKYYDSPRKAEGTPSASAMDQPDVEKHEGFASDMFTQEKIMNVLWFYPTDGATKILWSYPKDGAAKILWSYPKDGALVTWGTLNNMVHKARTKPASMPVDIEEDVSPDEEESASEEIEEYREVIVSIDTISEAEISHRADEEEEGPIKDEDFAAVEVDGEELEGESLSTKSVDVEEDFSLDEEESSSDETEEYGEAIVSIGTLSEDEISDDMEVGEEEEEETEERSLEGSADEEEILFAGSADIVAKDEIDLAVDENSSEEEDKEISLHSEVEEELSIEEEYGYDYSEDDLDGRLERDVVSNAVTEDAGLEEEGGESTMDDNGEAASDGDVIRAAVSGSSVGVSDTEDGSMEDLQEGGIELAIPLSFDSGDSDVLVEELSDTEIVEAFDSVIEPVGEDYESSNVTPKEQAASRRLEAESLNFFYRFLLARGFDRLLTTIILVAEWCRLYLRPIAEIPEWVVNKESKPLLSHDRFSFMKTRGGGLPEDETVSEGSEEEDQSAHEDSEEMETTTVETEIAEEERASDGDCRDKSRVSKDEKKGGGPETLEDAASGPGDDQTKDGNEEMATGHNTEPSTSPVPRVRPNPMYCFLLGYGRVGHILIMESILVIEWIKTYFPMLASLLDSVSAKIFPRNGGAIDGSDDFGLSQTTGFVSTDGSVVRGGKKRRAQTKKEDEKALSQLKQIGDIRQAKYRFLSESFMERHGLGLYASEWAEETVEVTDGLLSRGSRKKKGLEQEAEESDAEWIVEALTQESPSIQSKSAVEPNMDMSLGNSGASVRVGVEVSLGKSTKKRRRSSISDVARQTLVVKTKKPSGPRVSDRESGVMGRIRAAGANSLMGRSIMGAYPGDAPSPSEAADARGLIDLARKYGYGDWSDDEEEDDNEKPRKERRKKKERSLVGSQKGKGRKSRSSSLGLEFDFRSSDSVPRATARSALRHKNSVLGAAMDTLGEHRLGNDHRRKKRKSKFAEPAMENLREEDKSTKTRRVKKKVVRPAMELLKEVESKGGEESN